MECPGVSSITPLATGCASPFNSPLAGSKLCASSSASWAMIIRAARYPGSRSRRE